MVCGVVHRAIIGSIAVDVANERYVAHRAISKRATQHEVVACSVDVGRAAAGIEHGPPQSRARAGSEQSVVVPLHRLKRVPSDRVVVWIVNETVVHFDGVHVVCAWAELYCLRWCCREPPRRANGSNRRE